MIRVTKYLLLLVLLASHVTAACMTADSSIEASFLLNDTCYWVVSPSAFTSWQFARESCAQHGGDLAVVWSEELNTNITAHLTRSVYIGLYKDNDYTWLWLDGSKYNYDKEKISGKTHVTNHVIMTPEGKWAMVPLDLESPNEYGSLCAIEYKLLQCPMLEEVENAVITSGSLPAYIGHSVVYECSDQHQTNPFGETVQRLDCIAGPRWSTNLQNCFRVPTCPQPPPLLPQAIVTVSDTHNLSTATYTCVEGWGLSNGEADVAITCSADSGWNSMAIGSLHCAELLCEEDLEVNLNQFLSTEGRQVGVVRSYWCNHGFQTSAGKHVTDVTCLKPGAGGKPYWSTPRLPLCESMRCATVLVPRAFLRGYDDETVSHQLVGQSLLYQCNGTNRFPGNKQQYQTTCRESGQYDSIPPLSGCTEGECPSGWEAVLGSCYFRSDHTKAGLRYTSAMASCREKLSYLATVNDEDEMNLYFSKLYDLYGADYWIGYHLTGSGWAWHDNSTTNYTNFGRNYPELYDCARNAINGIWKDWECDKLLSYVCEKPAVCGSPPGVGNSFLKGYSAGASVETGTTAEYECFHGYALPDGSKQVISTCMPGGYWSAVSSCQIITCTSVNAAEMVVPNTHVSNSASNINSRATYTCNDGYVFPSGQKKMTIQCMEDGEWDAIPPPCQALRCDTLGIPNATAAFNYTGYGQSDVFTCEDGHRFPDGRKQRVLYCDANRRWNPPVYCQAVMCPQYYQDNAGATEGGAKYLDVITVRCNVGYRLSGGEEVEKKMTCSENGTWLGDQRECTARHCPGASPPNVTRAYRNSFATLGGSRVKYGCWPSYMFLDGTTTRTAWCSADTLEWTGVPEGCVDYETYLKSQLFVYPNEFIVSLTFYGNSVIAALFLLLALGQIVSFALDYPVVGALSSSENRTSGLVDLSRDPAAVELSEKAPSTFLSESQPVTDSQQAFPSQEQGQGESGELGGHTDRVSEEVTPTSTPNTSKKRLEEEVDEVEL